MADPASRYQPCDVDGASEVIDPGAYRWLSPKWRGRPWDDAVLYELHLGTFTSGGTFRAAIEKLDHLASLGVTAICGRSVAGLGRVSAAVAVPARRKYR